MSKSKPVFTLFFSLLIPLFSSFLFPLSSFAQTEETLTITTYYPAPYGVYNEMRLFPHTPASSCDSTKIGTMYYDSAPNENQIKVCTNDGWKNIGGDPAGKTLADFGNMAIYLSDGAEISGGCGDGFITGSARYLNGKIQTRVSGRYTLQSCDSGWVDGYSAECQGSGYMPKLIVTANTTLNGVSGYTSDMGGCSYVGCEDPLVISCSFPAVPW